MKKILLTAVLAVIGLSAWAVPARRDPFPFVQPNGDTITLKRIGDEHWHATFTVDGYLVVQNKKGYYCYATWKDKPQASDVMRGRVAVATRRRAKDEAKRTKFEKKWLVRKQIGTM